MKPKYWGILMLGLGSLAMTGCNDFLDKEPEDQVTPEKYFTQEADLASYAINLYGLFTAMPTGTYGIGTFGYDNGTDNQAEMSPSTFWEPGQWKVGESAGGSGDRTNAWNFYQIRDCNYFFQQVLPKYEAGQISGSEANIRHYIGEMYFLRAQAYFDKLTTIGDCPIITDVLPDEQNQLVVASKREPRNKVARFILEDLDKAIEFLSEESPSGKVRISRPVAYLFRSRVALYEGTWEKHHANTAFVPGGPGWPGKAEDVEGFNVVDEYKYFLGEAMKSAKVVGDEMVSKLANNTDAAEGMDASLNSLNPYYTMFCDVNMEGYDEVMMWRQFDIEQGITHNAQMQLERNGGGSGWTRGMVNSFLMANGLPIYDPASGYDSVKVEKEGVSAVVANRDSRLRIFTKADGDINYYAADGTPDRFTMDWMVSGDASTRAVTGYVVKKGKHYSNDMQQNHHHGISGSVVFRGAEALLNYMEASYELNGSIDATADQYWRALRTRAKVDPDYNKTIAHTDVTKEAAGDWGAYSHGQPVDATLYNIRRERRDELCGEAMRWDDLKRWRALDQIQDHPYQIEGIRYWGSKYQTESSTWPTPVVVDVDGETGNMSSEAISGPYVRPYQITKVNNLVFDGYHFTPAHYLNPLPQNAFRKTASGDQTDLNTSPVYQNPGWPKVAGNGPTDVR